MQAQRFGFIFLALYLLFFGGGVYFQVPDVRYFHHIFMSLLLGGWPAWRLWKKRGLANSPLNAPIVAFLLLSLASIPFSLDPRMALESFWFSLIVVGMYFFVLNSFQYSHERLVWDTVFILTGLIVFLSFIQIGSVFFGWGIGRPVGDGWINYLGEGLAFPFERDLRVWLPLGVSTWVAGMLAPLAVISFVWAWSIKNRFGRYFFFGFTTTLLVILLLSFSRGGFVSFGAAFGVFILLRLIKNANWLTRRNLYILSALGAVGIVLGLGAFFLSQQAARQSGDAKRQDLWRSATVMISENPLTGVGVGNFGRALRSIRTVRFADDRLSSAHNIYLNSAAELGLLSLVIGTWAAWQIGRSWWQLRSEETSDSMRRIRLDGVFAALMGFAVHNLFDTLNFMAALGLLVVMLIFLTTKPAKSRLDAPPKGQQWLAAVLLLFILAYGIWFVISTDPAQRHFEASKDALELDDYALALTEAESAESLDSTLNLYDLQVAFILGEIAEENPTQENRETAIQAYIAALELEPTWDIGWINLAALYEQSGEINLAIESLAQGMLKPQSPAWIHWARLQEAVGYEDSAQIIQAYQIGVLNSGRLPLSSFWMETPLRQAMILNSIDLTGIPLEWRYRIAAVHFPERLPEFLRENPQTAAEWWIIGEYALTVESDAEKAQSAFNEAIRLNPSAGDYYASRARASLNTNPSGAQRDLEIARFLGTSYEFPNQIAIALAANPEELESLRRIAVPSQGESRDFEGVLFGMRTARFEILSPMRMIGYGAAVMQAWYDLASSYEAEGKIEDALEVYHAILWIAPEETTAAEALERLESDDAPTDN